LTKEQTQLLEKTYKGFVRGGAGLQGADKERFKDISRQLSKLTLFFNKNVLAETNAFTLHIENEADLAGLPQFVVDAAHEESKALGKSDWVFTLQHPSYVPFMQYADNRSLRETMYKAFATRGNNNNEHDNKETIKEIVNLRLEKARLFGYNSYADFVLEERMAQNAQNVNDLLQNLFDAGHSFALDDKKAVEEMARELGFDGRLERWDWGYYSEKLRKKQYTITDEMTKPYFELSNVIDAVFHLAEQLYGLTFKPASDVPVYHADVQVFNVFAGENERLQAVLYLDFHPRKGKGQGAWMTTFREQSNINGEFVCPLVSLVTNFTKPGAKTPSLLTFDEVTTFLHEFGHALHAMLSDVVYESLSCTNVYRDFVELPSQMHENWALEKEWLQKWACHYKTKEPIPDELIEKIRNARNFNSGYQNDRQISFGWVDMAWHTLTQPFEGDVVAFEKSAMSAAEPLPPVEGTAFCTAFGHIFAGGYAAGYYGYKWAEVLDADAFELFKEKGIFNQSVAKKFADTILKQGGSDHPMTLYKAFRGKEPSVEALLERSGLLKK
jgi:peptidyl-dipeptidase Dcp